MFAIASILFIAFAIYTHDLWSVEKHFKRMTDKEAEERHYNKYHGKKLFGLFKL